METMKKHTFKRDIFLKIILHDFLIKYSLNLYPIVFTSFIYFIWTYSKAKYHKKLHIVFKNLFG